MAANSRRVTNMPTAQWPAEIRAAGAVDKSGRLNTNELRSLGRGTQGDENKQRRQKIREWGRPKIKQPLPVHKSKSSPAAQRFSFTQMLLLQEVSAGLTAGKQQRETFSASVLYYACHPVVTAEPTQPTQRNKQASSPSLFIFFFLFFFHFINLESCWQELPATRTALLISASAKPIFTYSPPNARKAYLVLMAPPTTVFHQCNFPKCRRPGGFPGPYIMYPYIMRCNPMAVQLLLPHYTEDACAKVQSRVPRAAGTHHKYIPACSTTASRKVSLRRAGLFFWRWNYSIRGSMVCRCVTSLCICCQEGCHQPTSSQSWGPLLM